MLGPTPRTASISPDVNDPSARNIEFDDLVADYTEATENLIAGEVDLLLIETVFDTLNAKAAIYAVKAFFNAQPEKTVPIMISVTFPDMSGRLLSGQTPAAFWNSIAHAEPLMVGVNCGRRFKEIRPFVEELANNATAIWAVTLMGLPNAFGEYDEAPDDMFDDLNGFAERGFLNAVGGCCGTTPEHIARIAKVAVHGAGNSRFSRQLPTQRTQPFNISADSLFVNMVSVAMLLAQRNSKTDHKRGLRHRLRYCPPTSWKQRANHWCQYGWGHARRPIRNEEILKLVASEPEISRVPIMIDSSKWEVIETGLKCVQGKAIVNSISIERAKKNFSQGTTV